MFASRITSFTHVSVPLLKKSYKRQVAEQSNCLLIIEVYVSKVQPVTNRF